MPRPVFLDHNSTTPMDPRVLDAMLPYFRDEFGNASSASHAYGWAADEAVTRAREQVARLIECPPEALVFTSGGTEAINFAIKGIAAARQSVGRHIVTTATEHKAVLDTCLGLRKFGYEISTVPVERDGRVTPEAVEGALRDDTILVAVMWANNETGVINPIEQISELARRNGVPFLSDAVQAVGKIPLRADVTDFLVGSSHKFYGPKGIGFLYLNPELEGPPPIPLIDGGGQERRLRGGTLNTPAIVGMGKAAEIAAMEMQEEAVRMARMRDDIEERLLSQCSESFINGNTEHRIPQTTNIRFKRTPTSQLLTELRDVAVSTGSACNSASGKPSHVLKAMGLSNDDVGASIRIGLGRFTTEKEVDFASGRIVRAVRDVRERLSVAHR